jgi:hypothetical protein
VKQDEFCGAGGPQNTLCLAKKVAGAFLLRGNKFTHTSHSDTLIIILMMHDYWIGSLKNEITGDVLDTGMPISP